MGERGEGWEKDPRLVLWTVAKISVWLTQEEISNHVVPKMRKLIRCSPYFNWMQIKKAERKKAALKTSHTTLIIPQIDINPNMLLS